MSTTQNCRCEACSAARKGKPPVESGEQAELFPDAPSHGKVVFANGSTMAIGPISEADKLRGPDTPPSARESNNGKR